MNIQVFVKNVVVYGQARVLKLFVMVFRGSRSVATHRKSSQTIGNRNSSEQVFKVKKKQYFIRGVAKMKGMALPLMVGMILGTSKCFPCWAGATHTQLLQEAGLYQ